MDKIPGSMKIDKDGAGRETLVRRNSAIDVLFLLLFGPFTLFGGSFMLFQMVKQAITGAEFIHFHKPAIAGMIVMGFVSLVFIAAGGLMTYFIFYLVINKTRINIANGIISVDKGPIPFFGRKNVRAPLQNVSGLKITETVFHRRHGGKAINYAVTALGTGGRHTAILDSLDKDEAEFLLEFLKQQTIGASAGSATEEPLKTKKQKRKWFLLREGPDFIRLIYLFSHPLGILLLLGISPFAFFDWMLVSSAFRYNDGRWIVNAGTGAIVGIIFLSVTVPLFAYVGLALLFNLGVCTVRNGRVSLHTLPFPLPISPNAVIKAGDARHLKLKEDKDKEGAITGYSLMIYTAHDKYILLPGPVPKEEIDAVEAKVRDRLKLES